MLLLCFLKWKSAALAEILNGLDANGYRCYYADCEDVDRLDELSTR